MNREEIIERIRQLDPEHLRALQRLLDLLEDLPENQRPGTGQDPEVNGPVQ